MAIPSHIGKFEVVSKLGEGGMGVVYLAKDPDLNRMVAIKVLSGYADESAYDDLRERFMREARSVASLTHNNIVTIHEIGQHESRPYIAMEFLDGETMAEQIRRRAPLTVARKLGLMIELCGGLAFAHRSSIIHRDIKPANLMITASRGLKILDFGLARAATDLTHTGLTRAGMLLGTPYYMAPEQIEGKPVDIRSDIFAVGIVLYELLAYRKAFDGDTPHVVLHNILVKTPVPIRELIPSIDPDLERIVARGLEKDSALRYQTLEPLGADLQRVVDRLRADTSGDTVVMSGSSPGGEISPRSSPRSGTPRSGQKIPNLQAISQRRQAQIDLHLQSASGHLAAGRYDEVIEECESVVVIDPREPRALEMLEVAHRRLEDSKVRAWLDQARAELSRGAFSGAEALVAESLALRPDSADALQMQLQIRDTRRERERAAERSRALRQALERARASFADGALDAAQRSISEAMAIDASSADARALAAEIAAGLEERERRREAEVAEIAARARDLAAHEDFSGALTILDATGLAHPLVAEARADVEELRTEFIQRETARRERNDQARRAAEDAARRERDEQARRAAEEAARREREEQARQAATEEAARREEVARRERDAQTRAAEDAARRDREERARREREEAARLEREERARRDREDMARLAREEQARRVEAERQRLRTEGERLISQAIDLVDREDLDGARELAHRAVSLVPDLRLAHEWRDHIDGLIEDRRLRQADDEEKARAAAAEQMAASAGTSVDHAPEVEVEVEAEPAAVVAATTVPARHGYEQTMPLEPEARRVPDDLPVVTPRSRRGLLIAAAAMLIVLIGLIGAGALAYRWWARQEGPPVPPAPGLIAMDVQPWAKVRFVGQDGAVAPTDALITPFQVSLPPGRYVVKCENPDLNLTSEFLLEVKSGETQTISRRFEAFNADDVVTTLLGKPK